MTTDGFHLAIASIKTRLLCDKTMLAAGAKQELTRSRVDRSHWVRI